MDHQTTVSSISSALNHGQPSHKSRASVSWGAGGESMDVLEHLFPVLTLILEFELSILVELGGPIPHLE